MGKKLKISQPTVINTELEPLIESFYLRFSAPLQQWYNPIEGTWSPDRMTTPLAVRPYIILIDPKTKERLLPDFLWEWRVTDPSINWYDHKLSNDATEEFYMTNGVTLLVLKNITDAASGITIRCIITYIDPRDNGRQYKLEKSFDLSVNTEVSESHPTVTIRSPRNLFYNPLTSESSQFTLEGQVDWNGDDTSEDYEFVWNTLDNGVEVPITQKPYYVEIQGTHNEILKVNAMFGENIPIILYMKFHSSDTKNVLSYDKCNIVWRTPPFDAIVTSDNGNMIKGDVSTFKFRTIINTKNKTLSKEEAENEFLFKWKKRLVTAKSVESTTAINDSANDVTIGWGYEIDIPASQLKNASANKNGSALVYSEVYLKGVYEAIMMNGQVITDNSGNYLYERV